MIDKESDIRPIGYGAMLIEGLVGVMALIAASALHPGDYFAINMPPAVFATLGIPAVNLAELLEARSARTVAGRTGGAVSLAVGMAQIFTGLPGMQRPDRLLVPLRDHVRGAVHPHDRSTPARASARFLVQEFVGRVYKPLAAHRLAARARSSPPALVVLGWGYFIWTGSIATIWPMFGIANQLLAVVALAVGTTILINLGRARYAWVTLVPLVFLSTTTLTAGFLSVRDNFWPHGRRAEPGPARPGLPEHDPARSS